MVSFKENSVLNDYTFGMKQYFCNYSPECISKSFCDQVRSALDAEQVWMNNTKEQK